MVRILPKKLALSNEEAVSAAAAKLVVESRAAQYLPPRIIDPGVIGRIAALVATQAARQTGEVGR